MSQSSNLTLTADATNAPSPSGTLDWMFDGKNGNSKYRVNSASSIPIANDMKNKIILRNTDIRSSLITSKIDPHNAPKIIPFSMFG